MYKINTYLNFLGNTEEAFNFYKSVFGGEFITLQRYKDMPLQPEEKELNDDDKEKILHITLPIGDGNFLMGCDSPESMGHKVVAGNNFYLSLDTKSKEETDRIFNQLSVEGKVIMPLGETFWGSYFGMCVDKFGIQWMVSNPK